jgi:septin family protein
MKHLGSRVNLIPIIAKADTLTPKDLAQYKLNVSPYSILTGEKKEKLTKYCSYR